MAKERMVPVRLLLRDLQSVRHLELDNECMPIRRRDDGMIEMHALASESALAKLRRMRKREVFVELLPDRVDEAASISQLVSPRNRYADGSLPRGASIRKD